MNGILLFFFSLILSLLPQVVHAQSLSQQAIDLINSKCLTCHGEDPNLIMSMLDMSNRKGLLKGGLSEKPALVPGKPEDSLMVEAITWENPKLQMPPQEKDRLSDEEVELIRQWIAKGAQWPKPQETDEDSNWNSDSSGGVKVRTSGGRSESWSKRKYEPENLWAYRPVQRYEVPEIENEDVPINNEIDAFVQQKLNKNGLKPAPKADKLTLLRRATMDLTGLPPTPEQVEAFLLDESPDAFEKMIGRLLNSPRYGEQMARHWLDVVRYADTSGFSNDFERPNAWRYRDYAIRSFNEDKPYDEFIREQIAGDEYKPEDPESLIAVGYLRMGPWEHTAMSVETVTRQQYLNDATHNVGQTFLAQGLRCARCHDHKFDPIPTKDFYRIQACFASVQFADREVPYLPEENISHFDERKKITKARLDDARESVQKYRKKHNQAVKEFLNEKGVEKVSELPKDMQPEPHYGLTSLERSLQKVARKREDYFEREMKRYDPYAFSVYSGSPRKYVSNRDIHLMPKPEERMGKVQSIHILEGGSLEAPAEEVTPGVLTAVYNSNDFVEPSAWNTIPQRMNGRRLALANWIASPNNTLTARVIVNRIWQHHFGENGIVKTPNNFGKMGGKPTHPKLLDYLATWFIEHGWSIKKLHKKIMMTAAYQRSSQHPNREKVDEADSKNDYLSYYPVRRLAAEEIRDSMLAISGELNPEMGGPGVYPEINWEVALQPRHIMGSVAPAYQPSIKPEQRHRRTIYAFRYRTLPDPMLEVFNRPGSDTSCPRRDETTVTPQVFALFNSQFSHGRALALADRLQEECETFDKQIDHAFQLIYNRKASEKEIAMCRKHYEDMLNLHSNFDPTPVPVPKKVKREMVEELTGEPFEFVEELDSMDKFIPDLKPWDVGAKTRALSEICLVLFNSNEFLYLR